VPDGAARSLWSVMIPTYNCARYLRDCLGSVLAQDPGIEAMHIEVVDDCSTADDPEAVVAELGKGRVAFYRQPSNVGHVANFNTCLRRSRGRLVHLLHGDDWVLKGFYERLGRLFDVHPAIGAAFCRHTVVNEHGAMQWVSPLEQPESGVLPKWLERIASGLPLQPPSIVVRREVYERLGGFDRRMLSCGEDWEMWVRIAAHYSVAYEPEFLALYRDNPNSLTKRYIRTGQNIRDVRKATKIIRSYLPGPIARPATKKAAESWADWALYWAERLLAKGDRAAATAQLLEGLRCSHSQRIVSRALPLMVQIAKGWLRRAT
jgi:glycosyltransferase involved in cell wall biosynthesis